MGVGWTNGQCSTWGSQVLSILRAVKRARMSKGKSELEIKIWYRLRII